MGVDKARLPARLDGQWWPLAIRVRRVVAAAGLDPVILRRGAPDGLPWTDPGQGAVEVVFEPDDGEPHPLWGVATALEGGGDVVVVSCDLPGITAASIRAVADAPAPAVAFDGIRVHPLIGHYPANWAARARAFALAGRSVRDFAADASRVTVDAAAVANANRPEDLDRGPLAELASALGFLEPGALERALAGERRRLRQRGVVAVM